MNKEANNEVIALIEEAYAVVMPPNDVLSHWARKGLLNEIQACKAFIVQRKNEYMFLAEKHEADIKHCKEHIEKLDKMVSVISDKIINHIRGLL